MISNAIPPIGTSSNKPRSFGDAREICRILFRHKRKMACFFCTVMAIAIAGIVFWPRSYTSDARLFVRIGRESVGLDPTANLNQTVGVSDTRQNEINSELEILRSRAVLAEVVSKIGADGVLGSSTGGEANWLDTIMTPVGMLADWLHGDIPRDELAINRLAKIIKVESPRSSSILIVKCRDGDAKKAQTILQAYLNAYLVLHMKANRTEGSHEFFVEQSELLQDQLTLASQDLRDAKNKIGISSIEGQRANIEAQANLIESAILENQRAVSSSEARTASLKKSLNELPESLLAEETDLPNSSADAMRSEFYKLQILEAEASSRYTGLHPQVIALRRQVDETRKIYTDEQARRNHKTRKLSEVHQSAQTALMEASALIASQKAEEQSLKQQSEVVQQKIRALNDNELNITDLSRQIELLEANYKSYTSNREQARVDQKLQTERISNVNVVQPAMLVAKPSSPRVTLTLILALFVATLGAILLPFAAEYFDRSLATPEQIERELDIPVLLSVPRAVVRNEWIHN